MPSPLLSPNPWIKSPLPSYTNGPIENNYSQKHYSSLSLPFFLYQLSCVIALNLRNFPPYFNIISTLYTRERKGGSWHSFTPLCPTLSHSLIGNPPFFESPPPIFLILHVVSSYMSLFTLHLFPPPPTTIYTPISHSPLSPTHSLTHLHHLSFVLGRFPSNSFSTLPIN